MRRSLQSSLLVGLLIGSAALVALGSSVIYVTRRRLLYQEFDRRLYREGHTVFRRPPRPPGGSEGRGRQGPFRRWRRPRGGGPDSRPAARRSEGRPWPVEPGRPRPPAQGPQTQPSPARSGESRWSSRGPWVPGRADSRPGARRSSQRGPATRPTTRPEWTSSFIDCCQMREDESGRVVFAHPKGWTDEIDLPQEPTDAPVYFDLTLPDGRPGRAQATRFTLFVPRSRHRGRWSWGPRQFTAVVAANTVALREELAGLRWIIALSALAGMAALALLVVGVVRHSLRPLRPLAQQIASRGRESLAQPVSIERLPAEIVPVVQRLNELLHRLDQAFHREQAFTANVAHELRTPLAGLRSTAEVALRRPHSPQEYQRALARILGVVVGLQDLVDKLLHLSRIDAGQIVPRLEAIRLREAVQRRWQAVCEQADQRRLALRNTVPADLVCRADPLLLEAVLANLLANAVQYADEGGTITVAAREADGDAPGAPDAGGDADANGHVVLTIANPAGGLSEEDVGKVLDRFWRKQASRTDTGLHFGLGLSLVQRCVQVHGGSVQADLAEADVFTVTLSLPGNGETQTAADE